MKITLTKAELLDVLTRGSLPLKIDPKLNSSYRGFGKIIVSGSKFIVQTVGQTVASRAFIHVDDTESEDGVASFSIEDMMSLLKFFPKAEDVVVERRTTEANMNGNVVIVSGKSNLTLPCVHDDLYQDIELGDGISVMKCEKAALMTAISSVVPYGMPTDADRVRSNVCFRTTGEKTYIGATDGIACCYRLIPEAYLDGILHLPINVTKSLSKFLIDGDVDFTVTDHHMYITQERAFLRVSVPDSVSKFPDYTRLMDIQQDGSVTMSTENLLQLMGACKQVNPEEAMMVVADNKVSLYALSPVGKTDYNGSVACAESSDPLDVKVGFSPFMAIEFLKHVGEESVDMEFAADRNIHGWPTHMKLSKGEYAVFIKSRMAMTSNPMG